ncbi:hypothetical protein SCUCBS95973_006360 [Sporothrix curviconia]|uniref:Major facilitator superfamily (MFS) profile domain-containing protein n=1 Tax=Sporothrix curviconia TaxID=1260050 RepID=A0ABP0C4J9_9PEZI
MTDIKTTTLAAEHADAVPGTEDGQAIMTTSALAARFEHRQHSLTRTQAFRDNTKPLAWCAYMFFVCIMWGFDSLAGGIVVAISEFRKDFGTPYEGDYVVDANWQLGWSAATLFGLVFGGLIAGLTIDRFGRQPVLLFGYCMTIGGVFLQVFSKSLAQFFGGKLLTGIPMGIYTTAAPSYASEMAPLAIRGSISAGMNFAIVLGQLIGYGVTRQASFYPDSRQYKVLFATQWGFVVVSLVILPFFVESPYWLVAHGREDKARKNLEKLHNADYDFDGHMAEIRETVSAQQRHSSSQGGMIECFSRENWRRTLVATSMFFIQNACGSAWVIGYMTYFMELAGMDASKAFNVSVGLSGVMAVGNVCGWFFVDWFGRRGTALYGSGSLAFTLLMIGILSCVHGSSATWGQVAFMGIWCFLYQGTMGAVAWPVAAEAATSRLRAPTQALATVMNGLSSCIWSFSLPYAVNPDIGNLQGKIAFIFAAIMVVSTVFIFFMVPETKNRTYLEIDELWARSIPPRKFKQTQLVAVAVESDKADAQDAN